MWIKTTHPSSDTEYVNMDHVRSVQVASTSVTGTFNPNGTVLISGPYSDEAAAGAALAELMAGLGFQTPDA